MSQRLRLGIETDTQDSEGAIIRQTEVIPHDREQILNAVHAFQGTVLQTPPMFSALKHKGTPLYRIARRATVDRGNPGRSPFSIAMFCCDAPVATLAVCAPRAPISGRCARISAGGCPAARF